MVVVATRAPTRSTAWWRSGSWSKATRDLLKSFSWGITALRQLFASDDGAISSSPAPYHLSRSPVSGDTPQRPLITSLAIIFPQSSASPSHRRLRPRRRKILAPSRCMPLVRSMLRRKRKKPLAGARSFPAVRHEPMNRDERLARAGAADRQGVPLVGGEQPVGCAL